MVRSYQWYTDGQGRSVFRAAPRHMGKRSSVSTPYVVSDTQEPLLSGADGKWYTSKSAMRASYRADGNPRGIEFTEIGNEKPTGNIEVRKSTDAELDASIMKAVSRLS